MNNGICFGAFRDQRFRNHRSSKFVLSTLSVALMSLAPIEAGALRQNKLTDHFFVAPTDRRFWDKVHKSRSFGFPPGFEGPSTSLKVHILGSWKFCMGGVEGFLYPEVSR